MKFMNEQLFYGDRIELYSSIHIHKNTILKKLEKIFNRAHTNMHDNYRAKDLNLVLMY